MRASKLIFCADDWGFSPGINEGILELARKGLIHSVSCTANTEYLTHGLEELLELKNTGITFNIHFNLTYKSPVDLRNKSLFSSKTGEFYPFKLFFLKSCVKKLIAVEIKREFEEQMRVLREHEVPITCLDGHQHVHLFPFIFKNIESSLKNNGISKVRYMSDGEHPLSFIQGLMFKNLIAPRLVDLQIVPCGYLLPRNFENLEKKLKKFERLIIHPAKFDDFSGKSMTDNLKLERIIEYNKLMEYFNER